jgi:hypothetical protein
MCADANLMPLRQLAAMIAALPAPRPAPGAWSVEAFIAGFADLEPATLQHSLPLIARLTRKVEVARRVYAAYASDLDRPATSDLLSPAYAPALCGICLAAAEQVGDYRSLNCALKMLDSILLAPPFEPSRFLSGWAERLATA